MNQRHLWTIVTLFMTVLGMPSIGRAQTVKETDTASQKTPSADIVKVGEYQSSAGNLTSDAVITEIHPHNIGGYQAATLFIRKIPVLTFVSSTPVKSEETKVDAKVGVAGDSESAQSNNAVADSSVKVASLETRIDVSNQTNIGDDDPVQRAGVVAAKINQLSRENVDASQIIVSWKAGNESTTNQAQNKSVSADLNNGDRYIIKVNNQELVEINDETRSPDTTNNLAQDALQATNRLRRLLGNASPLNQILNLPARLPVSIPKLPSEINVGPVKISSRGVASYYGYDGSGNRTASGQRFNPEGMTAAHRHLPFGTKVRVTNTRNGRSVVVRINDRGPFIRGRVIDLSVAAARILGMMGSGVAPVRIEVLGR
ncbi:MAG: septal ring lytic transglycosylase RlpA family protein [Hassallia sp. WJT32-NPBG1]|nr:septal ring lytic transglycosylase RlpA family protein [Spirirestis rafaelensis WJT71-NPBG6]MBW4611081.1 septal ring lytic transglycosylase RlpA family protein [Hassallia sp. WJT32-NPBG1]